MKIIGYVWYWLYLYKNKKYLFVFDIKKYVMFNNKIIKIIYLEY